MSKRRNGECSIFPYRNGYAAYAWVTTPDGERKRKWVYGKTHDEVHAKWIKLQSTAAEGPVPTSVPPLSHYLSYWLREVVKPNLAPKTYEKYETFTRLHIVPYLGTRRLDKLQVKTETSEAPLPLPELCVAALRLRQAQQQADRNRSAGAWVDTGLVFTTRHGTAVEPRNFSRSFDRCIVKAQVPRITVHGTRKTCGSLLAALDVHPRVAMQILRHSKIAVTMEIYTEVPSAATRDALRKLSQWLDS